MLPSYIVARPVLPALYLLWVLGRFSHGVFSFFSFGSKNNSNDNDKRDVWNKETSRLVSRSAISVAFHLAEFLMDNYQGL